MLLKLNQYPVFTNPHPTHEKINLAGKWKDKTTKTGRITPFQL